MKENTKESKKDLAKVAIMKKKLQNKQKLKDKKKENEDEEYEDIDNMLSIIEPPVFFDSAAELAQMFETNRSLIHVDFSFNDF